MCTVAGSPLGTFISPLDLSGGLIACHYTTHEDWLEEYGGFAVKAAQYYVKLLGRLL